MAKWGEGDPRWIVEERPDSVNVNNWHWTEKNCLPWTEQYLKDELKKLKKEVMEKVVSVTSVTVEGESTIGNRKGKIYFIYDLHLTIKWKGDSDVASAEGKIKVDDVCQDDDPDDYQYSITCEDETSLKAPLKDFAKSNLIPLIKKVLQSLKSDIRTAHEKDVLLPTKDSNAPQKQAPTKQVSGSVSSSQSSNSSSSSSALSDTKTVTMKIELLASAQDIFDALTNPQKVQIWTRSKAEITPKAGSAFSLFDGNITGEIISLDPGKKIEKKWRLRDWPQGHFSIVTLQLSQGSSSTDVELTQTLVPSDRFESTTENWHRFFWNQLKGVFGWGILD